MMALPGVLARTRCVMRRRAAVGSGSRCLRRSRVRAPGLLSSAWGQSMVLFGDCSRQDRGLTVHPKPALGLCCYCQSGLRTF